KRKAPFLQILAEFVRHWRSGGYFVYRPPIVNDGLSVNKAPDIVAKTAKFFLNSQETAGVVDCRQNLLPIPDDTGVNHEPVYVSLIERGHFYRIETGKRLAIVFSSL